MSSGGRSCWLRPNKGNKIALDHLPCRGKRLPRTAIVVSPCCRFGLAESVAVTRFEIGNDSSSVTIPVTDSAGLGFQATYGWLDRENVWH